MKLSFSEKQIASLNMLISFLAKRDLAKLSKEDLNKQFGIAQVDLLILLGNSIPYIAEMAAEAMLNGVSKELLIVGGIGHSTEYLRENIRSHFN